MAQNTDKTTQEVLESMKKGQSVSWPIDRIASIRAMASLAGMVHARKYTTKADRQRRVVIVTRTA